MSRSEWRDIEREPTPENRALEAAFIRDHWTYGALIHQETAKALVAALSAKSSIEVGHTLFLRLFAEFGNALESLGAWGWTIRNRMRFKLFMDTFLSYPHSAPGSFFHTVQAHEGDDASAFVRLLKLPAEQRVVAAMQAPWTNFNEHDVRELLRMTLSNLKQAADQYFVSDQIILRHYNRAKHGTTMVRTGLTDPREFQVIAPHLLVTDGPDAARYEIAKFRVDREMITRVHSNIEAITNSIKALTVLTRALLEANLLYVTANDKGM